MSQFQTVSLTNTFDFWRLRTNDVINRLNQYAINESMLYANTIIANNVLKSLGNTVLGVAGKKTIVNGTLNANGRFIVSASLSSTGNNILGAAGKSTIINGVMQANGSLSVAHNLTVSGNASLSKILANNSLGTAGYVLKTNGTTVYWDAVGGASVDLAPYLQVANAVATYTPKTNPDTSGLLAHTGRATISTNLSVAGNTSTNKLTVTSSLVSSGNTKLQSLIVNGAQSANGVLTAQKRFISLGNTVIGAVGKTTVINGLLTANGYMVAKTRFDCQGNTNLGGAGKKTVVNGFLNANGRATIQTNLAVSGNTSTNKISITNRLESYGNNVFGAAGKTQIVNGILASNGNITVTKNAVISGNTSTNKLIVTSRLESRGNNVLGAAGKSQIVNGILASNGNITVTKNAVISGNTSTNKMTVTSSITGSAANAQFLALGVGTTPSTNGSIRATNDITAYYSDERLKTKLGPIDDPMGKVRALSGFYFEANEVARKMGYERKREVGVSAQEVQSVLPEVVVPAPIDENYLTVKYEKLVPLLIEAIKTLDARIQELENK